MKAMLWNIHDEAIAGGAFSTVCVSLCVLQYA